MSDSDPSSHPQPGVPHPSKPPGWLAPLAVVLGLGLIGVFVWRSSSSGPRVGEKIELAPVSEVRANGRGFAENAANALRNLGRDRRPTSRPARAPAR
ncbi:MAG TPA: hypothetical protein PLD59_02215 [Tepidisphaeraceae bacterium]|nr:hypothetical protein [Tepidisphaeraceae bacterium]